MKICILCCMVKRKASYALQIKINFNKTELLIKRPMRWTKICNKTANYFSLLSKYIRVFFNFFDPFKLLKHKLSHMFFHSLLYSFRFHKKEYIYYKQFLKQFF